MYEPPIEIMSNHISNVYRNIYEAQEKYILETIHNLGVDVDKDELIRALAYDRDQYNKGYSDGRSDAVVHAKWEINCDGYFPYCSNCKNEPENGKMSKYCPECGAIMDGKD